MTTGHNVDEQQNRAVSTDPSVSTAVERGGLRGDVGNFVKRPKHLPEQPPASEEFALISMIERAARDPNCDIDKMERLFKMQQDAVSRRAKTDYLAAFAALQAELPAAVRRGTGHNNKKYARFEDIIEAIRPLLAKHGFSLSHRVDTAAGNVVRVTGVLGHEKGHSETTEINLPPDTSGNKTAVHAMASSISYGKRYTALTLTGIATEGEDDDAKAATQRATITEEQAETIKAELDKTGGQLPYFCNHYKLEKLTDLPASRFDDAMKAIASSAEKRRRANG